MKEYERKIYGLLTFGKILSKYRNSSDNKDLQKLYEKIHEGQLKELKDNTIEAHTNRQTKEF